MPNHVLPPFLKPEAMAPAPPQQNEEKKPAIYGYGINYIETYPLIKFNIGTKAEELLNFFNQSHELLKLYEAWGKTHNVDTTSVIKKFQRIENEFEHAPSKAEKQRTLDLLKEELKKILPTLQKPFQNQFQQLLNQFRRWGKNHRVNTPLMHKQINTLKRNIFEIGYSGSQDDPEYFQNIKKNLETIFITIQNDAIPLSKRIKTFENTCSIFPVCAGGIAIHANNLANLLRPQSLSVASWLAGLRTEIIQTYANIHNAEKAIAEGDTVHTEAVFGKYAEEQGWSSFVSMKEIKDSFAIHTQIEDIDLKKFHDYFTKEYDPTAIRACIEKNLRTLINKKCEEFGFDFTQWNKISGNYTDFFQEIKNIFNKLDIMNEIDFIESNDDDTQFKLRMVRVADILCERVLKTSVLYYDSAKKVYHKLLPDSWLDSSCGTMFDASAWFNISDSDFLSVLCRVFNAISELDSEEYIKYLHIKEVLEAISYEQLKKIKNDESYHNNLLSIQDPQKRAKIDKVISNFVFRDENSRHERAIKIGSNLANLTGPFLQYLLGREINGIPKDCLDILFDGISYEKLEEIADNPRMISLIQDPAKKAMVIQKLADIKFGDERMRGQPTYSKITRIANELMTTTPDDVFPSALCRAINGMHICCVSSLLKMLPHRKLVQMKMSESYKKHLSIIQNPKKRNECDTTISAIIEEKMFVAENFDLIFQTGNPVLIRNLLRRVSIDNVIFPDLLCRAIDKLPEKDIDTVLREVSFEKLEKMKNSNVYLQKLALIQNPEKRMMFHQKILCILLPDNIFNTPEAKALKRKRPIEIGNVLHDQPDITAKTVCKTLNRIPKDWVYNALNQMSYEQLENIKNSNSYDRDLTLIEDLEKRAKVNEIISDILIPDGRLRAVQAGRILTIVSDDMFSQALCHTINGLHKDYVNVLLNRISYEKLEKMKKGKSYQMDLAFILDPEKRNKTDKRISEILSAGEHKNANEERTVHRNAHFQPGNPMATRLDDMPLAGRNRPPRHGPG